MGINAIAIAFINPTLVYHSGQVIYARVLLSVDSPKNLKGLKVKALGKASVYWSESESYTDSDGNSQTRSISYTGEEIIFKQKIHLISGETLLSHGDHEYQFSTQLPPNLPTSYKGSSGKVEYSLQAKANIPWSFDKRSTSIFTVINQLNLNFLPNLREPFRVEKSKNFCCLCCKSRPLTICGYIPKTGYVPGERIPLTVEVDNASNIDIYSLNCYIKRTVKFTSSFPSKKDNHSYEKLSSISLGRVNGGSCETWSEGILVPEDVQYPYLSTCQIIKITYVLQIEADASGPHADLDLCIPIEIGSIPFIDNEYSASPIKAIPNTPPPSYDAIHSLDNQTTSHYPVPSAPPMELIEKGLKEFH